MEVDAGQRSVEEAVESDRAISMWPLGEERGREVQFRRVLQVPEETGGSGWTRRRWTATSTECPEGWADPAWAGEARLDLRQLSRRG